MLFLQFDCLWNENEFLHQIAMGESQQYAAVRSNLVPIRIRDRMSDKSSLGLRNTFIVTVWSSRARCTRRNSCQKEQETARYESVHELIESSRSGRASCLCGESKSSQFQHGVLPARSTFWTYGRGALGLGRRESTESSIQNPGGGGGKEGRGGGGGGRARSSNSISGRSSSSSRSCNSSSDRERYSHNNTYYTWMPRHMPY